MPTIEHFEIPAENIEKAQQFYKDVFAWEFVKTEVPNLDYWLIKTKDSPDAKGINGGLTKKSGPHHTNTNYIGVPSVEDYADKITKAGGKVLAPKQTIPGQGAFMVCQDPEGNPFGLWENV